MLHPILETLGEAKGTRRLLKEIRLVEGPACATTTREPFCTCNPESSHFLEAPHPKEESPNSSTMAVRQEKGDINITFLSGEKQGQTQEFSLFYTVEA